MRRFYCMKSKILKYKKFSRIIMENEYSSDFKLLNKEIKKVGFNWFSDISTLVYGASSIAMGIGSYNFANNLQDENSLYLAIGCGLGCFFNGACAYLVQSNKKLCNEIDDGIEELNMRLDNIDKNMKTLETKLEQ